MHQSSPEPSPNESPNEEKVIHPETHKYGLQEYLSLGYIYLILLGIISDVIYFYFFGINILKYAAISDILISPISFLVKDIRILIAVICIIGLGYFLLFVRMPAFHQKYRHKKWYGKIQNVEKLDKTFEEYQTTDKKINALAIFLVSVFLGMGLGSGLALQKRIEKGTAKATHSVTFEDMAPQSVRIIGQNSGFLFYLKEGQKEVSISPIGQVKEIQKISAGATLQK